MNRVATGLFASLLVLATVAPSSAQSTVDGSAEVSVARGSTQSADQESTNGWIGQNYTLGWGSTLIDPRLIRYNLQGMFRTNNLSQSATGQENQDGRAGDLGYKVGATVLPASSMPFTFSSSRTHTTSAGDLMLNNPIRSGLLLSSGAPPSAGRSASSACPRWNSGTARRSPS
jgi:hypothetical protein